MVPVNEGDSLLRCFLVFSSLSWYLFNFMCKRYRDFYYEDFAWGCFGVLSILFEDEYSTGIWMDAVRRPRIVHSNEGFSATKRCPITVAKYDANVTSSSYSKVNQVNYYGIITYYPAAVRCPLEAFRIYFRVPGVEGNYHLVVSCAI